MGAFRRPVHLVVLVALGLFFSITSRSGIAQSCQNQDVLPTASDVVTLKAVGDIVLGSDWPETHYPSGFEEQTQAQLKRVLGSADVVFGNFEGTLTTHSVSTKIVQSGTVFAFRMPPRFARLLRGAGFDVLNIANNHTFDFGETGFSDTLAHLADAGVLTVGERSKITLHKVKGVTLAWVGFSYSQRRNDMRDTASLAELIQEARKQADLVIVSIQAGAEGNEALRVVDREELFLGERRGNVFAFARRAVDLGADLVLGHGPHVLRGMECYKEKLIAYSLGNFVGYGALSIKRAAAISAILEVTLAKDRRTVAFNVIPVKFNSDKLPELDENGLARYLINDLSHLSPLNGTVRLPVATDGYARYQVWLSSAALTDMLRERDPPKRSAN